MGSEQHHEDLDRLTGTLETEATGARCLIAGDWNLHHPD